MATDFRGSWIDISDSEQPDAPDLDFLRANPSAALPPSPFSSGSLKLQTRPRAPTPSASVPLTDDSWSPVYPPTQMSPASSYIADSPSAPPSPAMPQQPYSRSSPLLRSVSESEKSFLTDSISSRSFARPPKSTLPDPSQFPDPYPFRPPHHHLSPTIPALSSAGSSSASTRSSAYTSSGSALASGDYGHVHVASGEEDNNVGVGITSDDVVQLLANDGHSNASSSVRQSRLPVDHSRWSESYSSSTRSRSSSVGQGNLNENGMPRLQQTPSYDMGWGTVDERDEVGMSEDETDDDHVLGEEDGEERMEEERTSAIVIAEEGRGLIIQAENTSISHLQIQPGTTHLIVGSSTTPNSMPSFLTYAIPRIWNTLLALDISANFLGALPPCLATCTLLEELNITSNPLRVLPAFLSDLVSLRVLIADATGISTLPDTLNKLTKLHTLSMRRNKMNALPSWLCLLPSLQSLFVDGNPFQGPWKALVEPLLAKTPMTPMYPPSTPMFPTSASLTGSPTGTDTDLDDLSEEPSPDAIRRMHLHNEEEELTITPERVPTTAHTMPSPNVESPISPSPPALTRTRTTPNRAFHLKARASKTQLNGKASGVGSATVKGNEDSNYSIEREVRKMKSAGDLRRNQTRSVADAPTSAPVQPNLGQYGTSASSSNLLQVSPERPPMSMRFASLGPSAGQRSAENTMRPSTSAGVIAGLAESSLTPSVSPNEGNPSDSPNSSNRVSFASPQKASTHRTEDVAGKEKGSRWGFLKKMSMGKMRIDTPSSRPPVGSTSRAPNRSAGPRANTMSASPNIPSRISRTPQIDMRFSTAGTLDALPTIASPLPAQVEKKPSIGALNVPGPTPSGNLLAPPTPTPRTAKRRSFLPLDAPLSLNIPIPDASAFVPGVTASNDGDDQEDLRKATPSPSPVIDTEQYVRREEERAREAYMRALRSVMAYLKDMNDLGQTPAPNPMSMYGASLEDGQPIKIRRPTIGEREVSMAGSSTTAISRPNSSGQLRSVESMSALRSGGTSQTLSIATTDSNSSTDDRKFKDDKAKRAMVVREIIETERTYVKGLQELVDIYIKPGSAPVNIITGVSSSKDTVVPAPERKIVFNGIDSLYSFHKETFLPALEIAAVPLMKSPSAVEKADADGQLSTNVARAVGNVFLKHAAFLKMYSNYINNFDNSVQRVKYWTSDRQLGAGSSPGSASSSTAQLATLGLTMSALSPGVLPEGVPNLTTSQRKRIKTYLKRCRISPRHSQLNLEGYLLLPVQRVPRYRLLLEELLRGTPPTYEYIEDPLNRALSEISSLANNMNEGKRESESRRKLVQWQSRIRGKFPSPLVQPHRRLIMDGPLLLTRVVRKTVVSFEAINAQGDASTVQVDCLAPELTPRSLIGILCNDLLVLCRDPSEGQDAAGFVDLWAVLRMQTLPQPASIVHGNALRLVDNKAILYFDAPTSSDALNWFRAINLHIPASKT